MFSHHENSVFNLTAVPSNGYVFSHWQLSSRLGPNSYDSGTKQSNPVTVSLMRQFTEGVKATVVQVFAFFRKIEDEVDPPTPPEPPDSPTPPDPPKPPIDIDECIVASKKGLEDIMNMSNNISSSLLKIINEEDCCDCGKQSSF